MKQLSLGILILILWSTAFSQKITIDTIYTKRGEVILATTISENSDSRIRYYPYPKKVAKYVNRSEILRIGKSSGSSYMNNSEKLKNQNTGDSPSQIKLVWEDVVYLKNESIIRGMIIEQVPNKSLKIQTKDGNVFVYEIEDVLKITKEQRSY